MKRVCSRGLVILEPVISSHEGCEKESLGPEFQKIINLNQIYFIGSVTH